MKNKENLARHIGSVRTPAYIDGQPDKFGLNLVDKFIIPAFALACLGLSAKTNILVMDSAMERSMSESDTAGYKGIKPDFARLSPELDSTFEPVELGMS